MRISIVCNNTAPLRERYFAPSRDCDLYCPLPAALANLCASSAARNNALALLTHSCCSLSGWESATIPAPAWTYILPSLMRAVGSTMQLSMSPAAEKKPTRSEEHTSELQSPIHL